MTRTLPLCCAFALLLATLPARAADFVFEVASPKFKVSIPNLPAMKMETHPLNAKQPHLRFLGSEGPYTVQVATPTAAAGMTALECAGATLRSMATRPGLPPSSEMYKAKLDDSTFVAMYLASVGDVVQLHAHLFSAAGGTHCVEVHASKMSTSQDELDPWFDAINRTRIQSH